MYSKAWLNRGYRSKLLDTKKTYTYDANYIKGKTQQAHQRRTIYYVIQIICFLIHTDGSRCSYMKMPILKHQNSTRSSQSIYLLQMSGHVSCYFDNSLSHVGLLSSKLKFQNAVGYHFFLCCHIFPDIYLIINVICGKDFIQECHVS